MCDHPLSESRLAQCGLRFAQLNKISEVEARLFPKNSPKAARHKVLAAKFHHLNY